MDTIETTLSEGSRAILEFESWAGGEILAILDADTLEPVEVSDLEREILQEVVYDWLEYCAG